MQIYFSMAGNLLEELGWAPGDRCYAQFSEDQLWYPAIIMREEKGCVKTDKLKILIFKNSKVKF